MNDNVTVDRIEYNMGRGKKTMMLLNKSQVVTVYRKVS